MHYTWTKTQPHDIKQASKYLLYPGDEIVKKTLEATTQLGKTVQKVPLRPHYKTRNPILSKTRLMEPWATDTWFAKVTSYEGYNCCQLFVGHNSKSTFLYGMRSETLALMHYLIFSGTLEYPYL